ncbi:MAG: protein DedD [Mesorhizobium sp.]|uniref:Protein DedD n=1 Tax=Mesorhizobium mediterraneum TaxID=43617 RepID=A0AB36RFE1_9HYPH|nr:protein DedD [Mesorhizobium sp. M6A.T.Cr.TU.016.01.1.1]PAQ03154.1 protein DedD [Mesorhizobium mediterraneum]RUU30904.1 protein DedD [Mesorhizobium sp. M6A.T.Ce.TU.016.01.1.1]RUV04577.1 protein DedD [Mesorhizobium sp. M6A.T.Cr.TU.017.01.1.1]RWN45069.1 MAG: protein DedD [Mesorhizobium sp.]
MRLKETNDPDASMRPGELWMKAAKATAADFCRPANERKTRQKYSRLFSPCVAPVTGRP